MQEPRLYPWKRRALWWVRNPRLFLFQMREVGGIASAAFGLLLLYMLRQYHRGESSYTWLFSLLGTLPALILLAILLAFVFVHATTWMLLVAKAQPVVLTKRSIPWKRALGLNLVLWAGASVAVFIIVFGGP